MKFPRELKACSGKPYAKIEPLRIFTPTQTQNKENQNDHNWKKELNALSAREAVTHERLANHTRQILFPNLISLLIASSCCWSMSARVCASVCPDGDRTWTESNRPSSSSGSASPAESNACWTFARMWACCNRSQSCSFNVLIWNEYHVLQIEWRDKSEPNSNGSQMRKI